MRFNKNLSQLEAIYQIATPVRKKADKTQVSDFIHHIFENQEKYGLNGLSKEWFCNYSKNKEKAVTFVDNLLQKNDHIVEKSSINEAIEVFQYEEQ